ncbi:hypothetical protein [Burkholderia contaminans]|uniref:hypothetical protein n=1 Tax=Burkholderia contaminans TaxID=488447 RepID=UPI000F595155|nr:hypothetical protein [Burkholderia contaminans]
MSDMATDRVADMDFNGDGRRIRRALPGGCGKRVSPPGLRGVRAARPFPASPRVDRPDTRPTAEYQRYATVRSFNYKFGIFKIKIRINYLPRIEI